MGWRLVGNGTPRMERLREDMFVEMIWFLRIRDELEEEIVKRRLSFKVLLET